MNAIVTRATIDEIVGFRNLAVEKFQVAMDAIDEALETAAKAAGGTTFYIDRSMAEKAFSTYDRGHEQFLTYMRQQTDRAIWSHLIKGYGFEKLMDRQASQEFRDQLEKEPPEVTVERAEATLGHLMMSADSIFRRGVANAFSGLDRRFRSHDGFKIGDRVVLESAIDDYGGWNHWSRKDETLRDIERAFHELDGKEMPERYAGIIGLFDDERRRKATLSRVACEVEDEYFRLKAFKNGNIHLWFKRDDLLRKVNKLLAEHYGEVLGAGSDAVEDDPLSRPNTSLAKNLGWFPTPRKVAEKAVGRAGLSFSPARAGWEPPHLRILEPSAGEGAIVKAVAEAMHHSGATYDIDMVEIHHDRAETLQDLRLGLVIEQDFLAMKPDPIYDRIIMNPPFDQQRDIDHVAHAVRFLKPGGKLVAIMSASVEFRQDKKATAFRALIEKMDGSIHDLPPGSFEESGTMVNTCIVVLKKPN